MAHASGLSRQDTLPADDPSWSFSVVPGQPAPIPPRNEPLLFISNPTAHACLKNLPKDHATSRIEMLTSSTNTTNSDDHGVSNFHYVLVCSEAFDSLLHADCAPRGKSVLS